MIYVFFGLWAIADVYYVYLFVITLINIGNINIFVGLLPTAAFSFFQVVGCLAGFFLFQRNREEALGQQPLPTTNNGPLLN